MRYEELVGIFREVELLRDLDEPGARRLAAVMEQVTLPPGAPLFAENEPRQALYIVRAGAVELSKRDAFDRPRRVVVFGPNDFIGEGALMDDTPHSTSARARGETTVLLIRRDRFTELFKHDTDLATRLLARVSRVIARRMQQATTRAVSAAVQYASGRTRAERDLLGERDVPYEAYFGVQTLRAHENFQITGVPLSHYPALIEALALVKIAAARANAELDLVPAPVAAAIERAGQDILQGKFHNQFVIDMLQGGAGTSTNMNMNEVLANRALEVMGQAKGEYAHCHPNNHVNASQSTNDAYPTAIKLAVVRSNEALMEGLEVLIDAFRRKADEFAGVLKLGRTQLQDAVPMTLGQEFEAFAVTLAEDIGRLRQNAALFLEINLGGTAIGTGINTDPRYGERVVGHLQDVSGLEVVLADNLVEATQDTGAFVSYSGALKRLAVKLSKICNDLRLLSSGPRAGLGEINLPAVQPGSSIMPGKVNPVIPEVVNQIAFRVIGNDLTVTLAAEAGQLQLNVMLPVIALSLLDSIEMLRNGIATLALRCVGGITANVARCREHLEHSLGLVTALVPAIGYEAASELAKRAQAENRGIYDLVLEMGLLTRPELDRLLDPAAMLWPGAPEPGAA